MEQYIPKSVLVTEIEKLISNGKFKCQQSKENNDQASYIAWSEHIATCGKILCFINSLEVKDGNKVPATVMINKYGNRFISSWPGLKEYDNLKEGEEIKIVIPKK